MARIGRRVREGRPRGPTPSSTAATTTEPTSAKSSHRDPRGASSGPRGGPGIGAGPPPGATECPAGTRSTSGSKVPSVLSDGWH